MSEPSCWALCYSGESCFSNVGVYLKGTVLQWCRLFKRCLILPAGRCVTVVQTVKAVSEPSCGALCYSGAGCLSGGGTYLPGTVLQWCSLFKRCRNLPARHCVTLVKAVLAMSESTWRATVLQWCRLFKRCRNLTAEHCIAGVQAV